MSELTISDEMVDAYVRAIFTDWYIEMKGEELRQDVRDGLAAVVPLIRAQAAAERGCVLCNPGSPEEIRQREEASAELDQLIVDDDEDLPPGVHRERDGFLVMERNGPPPNLDDYGPPVVIAPPPDEPVADVLAAFEAHVAHALRQLDGSTASAVALLTGMSRDEIDQFGGIANPTCPTHTPEETP